MANAMSALNEREQHIIAERRLSDSPKTLEELSKEYSISRERVRQIEARAFEKLQIAMQSTAAEDDMLTIEQ
jgi:RNA polymerase sigma-32 factor